jgi:hypothetical protein
LHLSEDPRPHPRGPFKPSRSLLEFLEPSRQPVLIGTIRTSPWQMDHLPDDPLEAEFEKRRATDFEQPIGDMDAVIRVDADQVGVRRPRR